MHRNLHHINQVTDRQRGALVETVLKHGQEARHFYTKKGWLGYGPKVLEDGDRERQDNAIFGEEGLAIWALCDIPSIRKHRIQLSSLTNKAIHWCIPFIFFM